MHGTNKFASVSEKNCKKIKMHFDKEFEGDYKHWWVCRWRDGQTADEPNDGLTISFKYFLKVFCETAFQSDTVKSQFHRLTEFNDLKNMKNAICFFRLVS